MAKMITQKDVDMIKTLLNAGVKKGKVREITGKGYATITRVEKSDGTLAGYRKQRDAYMEKYRAPKQEVKEKTNGEVKTIDLNKANNIVSVLKAIEHNQQKQIAMLEKIAKKRIW